MRKPLLFSIFSVLSFSQPSPTLIVGPIYTPFGGLYTGSFTVTAQAKTNTGWAITGQPLAVIAVNAGVISGLTLVPNDTSVPNLTSYLMTFANNDSWICIVPTSSTSVNFASICSPNALPPNVGYAFPSSSIIPATSNGYVMTTVGGISTWAPSTASVSVSAPLVYSGGVISIPAATSSVNGYLTSADWSTFNSKQYTISSNVTQLIGNVGGVLQGVTPNQVKSFTSVINTVSFNSAPNFDLSLGSMQMITLVGNVTSSTFTNGIAGAIYTFMICQDLTGGRTFSWGASFHGPMTVGALSSKCSTQQFIASNSSTLYSIAPGETNQ